MFPGIIITKTPEQIREWLTAHGATEELPEGHEIFFAQITRLAVLQHPELFDDIMREFIEWVIAPNQEGGM